MKDTIVKATVISDSRYKDQGLQQTIEECKDVKTKLRKVEVDPDVARKEKRKAIRKKQLLESLAGARTTRTASSPSSSMSSSSSTATTTASLSPSSPSSPTTTFSISPGSLQRARRFLGHRSTSSTSTSVSSSGERWEDGWSKISVRLRDLNGAYERIVKLMCKSEATSFENLDCVLVYYRIY